MINPITSILYKSTRNFHKSTDDKLNILTYVSHERFEPNLCLTGHNFFALTTDETRKWNTKYAPIPPNYTIFQYELPQYIMNEIDLIISHNPFVHIPHAINLHVSLPIINVFHTMPPPGWDNINIHPQCQYLFDSCIKTIYISEFNKLSWGYNKGDVILHGIDVSMFAPGKIDRKPRILTVANDYINRNWCLGFNIWQEIAKDLPMLPIGETPGLSKPADSLEDMIKIYQESLVFLNTSTSSPIPMSVLEAMSCGCATISAATCMLPDIIEDGVDGFLCPPHKPEMFKERCKYLLENPDKAMEMGLKGREKIKSMFDLNRFVQQWESVLQEVC